MGPAPGEAPVLAMSGEVQRKILHLIALVVPVAMVTMGRIGSIFTLGLLAALAVTADVLRALWPPFSSIVHRVFGGMMRPEEAPVAPGATGPVVVNGATWVLVAGFLLAVLVPIEIGALVFAAFLVADAGAALVGRTWGRHPWRGSSRTFEGSAAFVATALALLLVSPELLPGLDPVRPWQALLVALGMAWLEAQPIRLNDNVLVPTLGALLLWHLGAFV